MTGWVKSLRICTGPEQDGLVWESGDKGARSGRAAYRKWEVLIHLSS